MVEPWEFVLCFVCVCEWCAQAGLFIVVPALLRCRRTLEAWSRLRVPCRYAPPHIHQHAGRESPDRVTVKQKVIYFRYTSARVLTKNTLAPGSGEAAEACRFSPWFLLIKAGRAKMSKEIFCGKRKSLHETSN